MSETTINRRSLLAASLAASVAGAALPLPLAAADGAGPATGPAGREYYELRLYHLRRGPMQKRADDYFRDALIPALGRRPVGGPVGVFNVVVGPDNPTTYVLIPHASLDAFAALPAILAADASYRTDGEAFLAAPPTDPPYVTAETSLLAAVRTMPRLEPLPGPAGAERSRRPIFELRTYRSHNERAAATKVEMFEAGGELALFRRAGLQPVFFARGLTGTGLPSLTYMLGFPDLATREKNWNTFREDPAWTTLSTTPGYTDAEIVASINSVILAPAPYSQV